MRLLVILSLIISSVSAFAQSFEYEDYSWKSKPSLYDLDTSFNKEPEVITKDFKMREYGPYVTEEGVVIQGSFVEYETIHKRIRVNTEDGVQSNNKVYIGLRQVVEVKNPKARVITPEGKVIDFDESKIMESEGGDGLLPHKYFAIDGVEIGSDIEFMYTLVKLPTLDGERVDFQGSIPRFNVGFRLIVPGHLEFAFKSYNGLSDVSVDDSDEDKIVYQLGLDEVKALKDEDWGAYRKSLKHLVYKIDKNNSTGAKNIINYSSYAKDKFEEYLDVEKKDLKAVKKFVKLSGALEQSSVEMKVRVLEEYLKTNVFILDGARFSTMKEAFKTKVTSHYGMIRIALACIRELGVPYELVFTCDSDRDYFDEDFETQHTMQEIMFYFPTIKKYMYANEYNYRLGFVPEELTNHYGLFIKEISVGSVVSGLGKVKFIEALDETHTEDRMEVTVNFDEDLAEPSLQVMRSVSGYSCLYIQPYYELLDEDAKKEYDEAMVKFSDEAGEIVEYTVSGFAREDIGINPMVFEGVVKSSSVMEKAGTKYLFNVGQLIGPQMEMYQEEERQMDISHRHNMVYTRVIKFKVPEGYKVSGLEALKIDEVYSTDKGDIYFKSDYVQEGDLITVTIKEVYQVMDFTKEEYEDFRRIINAAANFNKVVLFFEKK